jgi:hypothetical protein
MLINFDLLPVGATVFEQFPGVRFPGTLRIVQPSMGTASGMQALSNAQPGEEFNNQPLVLEFSALQRFVRLLAGLDRSSSAPIQATLRAFNSDGNVVAQDGPIPLGPGPTVIRTLMRVEVATPSIVRAELEYSGAFAEVIDDLEFEFVGPAEPPDTQAPTVSIIQPVDGTDLTGELFILEAEVQEDRKLRSVTMSIDNDAGTQSFELSFFGVGPLYRIGPFWTGPIAEGTNSVELSAEDFAGNIGVASIAIHRVQIEGRLLLPEEPVELPRLPGSAVVQVELSETFPGSLNGCGEITIRVVGPEDVRGFDRIRDFLTQPVPRLELQVFAGPHSPRGAARVVTQAIEAATGRILDTASFPASITPGRGLNCGGFISFYVAIDLTDLTKKLNDKIKGKVQTLNDMTVQYGNGVLKVKQQYLVEAPYVGFIEAKINFYAELRPTIDFHPPPELELPLNIEFEYQIYHVNASPNVPVIDPLTAAAWRIAQELFENQFTEEFREAFRKDLGAGIVEGIIKSREDEEDGKDLLSVLRDIYINPHEFGLGFCIPGDSWGEVDPLRSDDFSSDRMLDFEVVDDPQADVSAPSNWLYNAAEQRIEQTSNIHGPDGGVNTNPNKPGTYLVGVAKVVDEETGEEKEGPWPELRGMVLECHLNSGDDDGIGVVFRYLDVDNFYFFLMDAQRNYRRLGKKVGGEFYELEVPAVDTTQGYNLNQDYELTIIAGPSSPYIGEVCKVYLDGVEILSGRDRSIVKPGRVGFYAWGNTSARFLDLTVHPGGLVFNPATL